MEIGCALECRADLKQGCFIKGAADQLHGDGKALGGEAARDRQRRQPEIVDRAREARQALDHAFHVRAVADVAFGNGWRRHRCDRRDHRIDIGGRRDMG